LNLKGPFESKLIALAFFYLGLFLPWPFFTLAFFYLGLFLPWPFFTLAFFDLGLFYLGRLAVPSGDENISKKAKKCLVMLLSGKAHDHQT
jgi:hypothetical protein